MTVNACEVEAGKDNVLHLAINSGTDLALFNALFTYIADKGWVQKDFIEKSTLRTAATRPPLYPARGDSPAMPGHLTSFEAALEGCRMSIDDAAKITGLNPADIVKAAEWIGMPKEGGERRRVMFGYEKGLIWGNDNYRTNGALVNIALATGNVGQLGGGVVRLGGHQEGYVRPDYPGPRPAPYVDQLLIEGKGGVHHIWDCDHYKTTLNADKFKQTYKKRTDLVKDAMSAVPYGDRKAMVDAILAAIGKGGLFAVDVDIVPTKIGQACHVWLPAATAGEMNLTSMNGERRLRLTERYMDPPGQSMPDCLIAARLANNLERVFREMGKADDRRQVQGLRLEDRGRRLHGRLSRPRQGRRVRHLRTAARHGNQRRPGAGDRLRERQARRNAAALHRRRLLHGGRQGAVHGRAVARARGAGQRGGIEEVRLPHQQRPRQPRLAERLSRPARKTSSWIAGPIRSSR